MIGLTFGNDSSKGQFTRYDFYDGRMQLPYTMPTTKVMSKSNLQLPNGSHTQHEKCRSILKHVLNR